MMRIIEVIIVGLQIQRDLLQRVACGVATSGKALSRRVPVGKRMSSRWRQTQITDVACCRLQRAGQPKAQRQEGQKREMPYGGSCCSMGAGISREWGGGGGIVYPYLFYE